MVAQTEIIRFEALAFLRDHRYECALTLFDYLARTCQNPHDYVWRALLRLLLSDYEGAIHDYGTVLEQIPDDLSTHHHLAAIRSSCPVDVLRDGQLAMEHAKTVARIRPVQTWRSLSVLAACYAENADFANAIEITKQALMLTPVDYRERLERRILDYADQKPYRMTPEDIRAAVELPEHSCVNCGRLGFVIWHVEDGAYKSYCIECAAKMQNNAG